MNFAGARKCETTPYIVFGNGSGETTAVRDAGPAASAVHPQFLANRSPFRSVNRNIHTLGGFALRAPNDVGSAAIGEDWSAVGLSSSVAYQHGPCRI